MTIATRTVQIGSTHGLHARPAKLLVKAVSAAGIPVTLAKAGSTPVNAASILSVIAQAISSGEVVTLTADGEGASAVLDELATLLSTNHDAA